MARDRKSRGSWALKVALIAGVVYVGFRFVESKGAMPAGITGSTKR